MGLTVEDPEVLVAAVSNLPVTVTVLNITMNAFMGIVIANITVVTSHFMIQYEYKAGHRRWLVVDQGFPFLWDPNRKQADVFQFTSLTAASIQTSARTYLGLDSFTPLCFLRIDEN